MKFKIFCSMFVLWAFAAFGQEGNLQGVIIAEEGAEVTSNPDKKVALKLFAQGAKQMMISNDESFIGGQWEVYETRKPHWKLLGEDGLKTIYAKFRDAAGNVSASVQCQIELDRTPPSECSILINEGLEYLSIKDKGVKLTISALDAFQMRVSNRKDFLGAGWAPYATDMAQWILMPGDGEKSVFVQFKDKAGNVSALAEDAIKVDRMPPQHCKIIINNDSVYATSSKVKLQIKAEDASEMVIRGGAGWIPYAEHVEWEFTDGDGPKEVYVKFRDANGNGSVTVMDKIILDVTAPTHGRLVINNGSRFTKEHSVALKIIAQDASHMIVSDKENFAGAQWEGYKTLLPSYPIDYTDGKKTIYIKFKDLAGNESQVYSDDIELDNTAPTGASIKIVSAIYDSLAKTAIINDEAKVVTLEMAVSEADYMMVSNISTFYEAKWEIFKPKVENWGLGGGTDGEKHVFVKYRDRAGNISEVATDKAVVDTQPPLEPRITIDNNTEFSTNPDKKVKLQLFVRSGSHMMISNASTFEKSKWIPFLPDYPWELDGDDGVKTVAVKFKDYAGNESEVVVDNIVLDRKAPEDPSILLNKGAASTNHPDKLVIVKLKAKDAVTMQLSNESNFNGARWLGYSESNISWKLSGEDGMKMVFAKFKDQAGNITQAVLDSIILDRTPPMAGTVAIENGQQLVNNTNLKVTLQLFAENATQMRIGNNFDFAGSEWESYATNKEWTLTGSDGLKIVYAQFRDTLGNMSVLAFDKVGVDREAPRGGSIAIGSGEKYATDINGFVRVRLRALDAQEMMLSNTEGFEGGEWMPFKPYHENWLLAEGDGEKRVFAKFRDKAHNETTPVSSFISLDRQEPVGEEIIINNGEKFCSNPNRTVKLFLKCDDAKEMMISNTHTFKAPAKWEPYKSDKEYVMTGGEGKKVIYVKYRDEAGNESATASSSIILDTQAPIPVALKINAGKTMTQTSTVTLNISTKEADYMMVSNDSKFVGAVWEPYAVLKDWVIKQEFGLQRVYIKFKDEANNETGLKFADITLVE